MSKYGVFSGPYFPAFGLNTEIYSVNLRIKSECGKIWTRKNPYLDNFHAVYARRFSGYQALKGYVNIISGQYFLKKYKRRRLSSIQKNYLLLHSLVAFIDGLILKKIIFLFELVERCVLAHYNLEYKLSTSGMRSQLPDKIT